MFALIKAFFAGSGAKILEWLGIIGGVLGAFGAIYRAGQKAEAAKGLVVQQKEIGVAHEIEDKNRANLPDGGAAQQLRDKWTRG